MLIGAALPLALDAAAASAPKPEWADLAAQVEIRRTAYGVPHIKAENERALGFGFGYCQAEDHLLSIQRLVLTARGELARTFGRAADVESDFYVRQFRVRERAVATYHKLDPDFRDLIEGFAEGMNAYIHAHREGLPAWVRPVTAHDVAAHGMTGVMRFAFNRNRIIERFLRAQRGEAESEETAALQAEEAVVGSNLWAFGPSRTRSRKAILMGNPHQPWSEVATYYEAHLTVPGVIDFYGSTFVGRPVLTTGFNAHLGWTHTVNYPDLEEIYELKLDPTRPEHFLFDGDALPIQRDDVTIEVKTDKGLAPQTRAFFHTALGPVIHRTDDRIYVLRSASYEEFRFYQQWFRMSQARNFAEFQAALALGAVPMFNTGYADREGNIYYLWNGTVPVIPHENQDARAVPAARSADIWTHFLPLKELPQLLNPKGGYVQNSNDPPYFTNLNEPLDIRSFPPYFPPHRLSLRTQHSLELIHNRKRFSLEDVVDLKFSPRMLLADRVKDDLIAALKLKAAEAETLRAREMLERWNNTTEMDSRGSVLFEIWWTRYQTECRRAGIEPYAVPWSPEAPITTPRGLADAERAAQAFAWALGETSRLYGAWDATWGEVHRLRKGKVEAPVSGGGGAIGSFRVLDFRRDETDGKLVVRGGDSWIFAVEFGDTPRAYTVVGYSESEVPDSPHYDDQGELFAANKMKRAAFTEAEIEAQLLRRYRPSF